MRPFMKAIGVLAGLAFAGNAFAADVVKIGVLAPVKSVVGKDGLRGAEFAAELINQEGGVLGGRQIELVKYDTNFAPADGVAAVQRLLTQDDVRLIAGEISSSVALAISPVIQSEGGLFIAATPKHPDVTKGGFSRIFRLNSTTAMDAKSFNRFLAEGLNPEKVAVIAENSDFGRVTIENLKQLFGSKMVFSDTYGMAQADFSSIVTNAKASGPDLICIAGANPEQYGNILIALQKFGYSGRPCIMPGVLDSQGVKIAGSAADGAVSADVYVPSLDNETNKKFVSAFEAKYGKKPEKVEELFFEGVWIIAHAVQDAGSATDTDKIAEVIHQGSWPTPRGKVTFDKDGQAESGELIRLEVHNGTVIPLRAETAGKTSGKP